MYHLIVTNENGDITHNPLNSHKDNIPTDWYIHHLNLTYLCRNLNRLPFIDSGVISLWDFNGPYPGAANITAGSVNDIQRTAIDNHFHAMMAIYSGEPIYGVFAGNDYVDVQYIASLKRKDIDAARHILNWNPAIWNQAAYWVETPVVLLDLLSKHSDSVVRESVGRNDTITEEIRLSLASDWVTGVRKSAFSRGITPKLLKKIVLDRDPTVKIDFIQNAVESYITAVGWYWLAKDSDVTVRLAVAEYFSIKHSYPWLNRQPKQIQTYMFGSNRFAKKIYKTVEILSIDTDARIRMIIAGCDITPKRILSKLSNDLDCWVGWVAICNPRTPDYCVREKCKSSNVDIRRALASKVNVSGGTLARMVDDSDIGVLTRIAEHSNTLPETLAILKKNLNNFVRWSVERRDNLLRLNKSSLV